MADQIQVLLADPRVVAARRHLEARDEAMLARQAELSAIPAPTGSEAERGARVAELFRAAGLAVDVDGAGNVRASIGPGSHAIATPAPAPVVVAAHLDTVFGPEIDVSVRRSGLRLEGPGISDNALGLAALVAIGEALVVAGLRPARPVWLVATVGEEGAGNLRGARHLLDAGPRPAAFVALDGAGLGRIVHRAVGSRRYRIAFRGPGGHSWAAAGTANPAAAVGRAAAAVADLALRPGPRTTAAVVGLGGGTGLNMIPPEAWLDLDLRSESRDALEQLDGAVHAAVAAARDEENRRRAADTVPLSVETTVLGDRPSGTTPEEHPLVAAAVAATRALGAEPELAAGSTDASAAIGLGIPAVALGAGGRAGDMHRPCEWYEHTRGALGPIRALLVIVAAAGAAAEPT